MRLNKYSKRNGVGGSEILPSAWLNSSNYLSNVARNKKKSNRFFTSELKKKNEKKCFVSSMLDF